jgi:hypothetical protein
MAKDKVIDCNATLPPDAGSRRGGTQGGEPARALDPNSKEGGTSNLASASGVAVSSPHAEPVTGIDRQPFDPFMRDGTPLAEIQRCLEGIKFPALKHDVVHHATRAGANEFIVAELERIPVSTFQSVEHVLHSYGEMQVSSEKPLPPASESK